MSDMVTVDTNVLARYLLADLPEHAERATGLLRSAARGDVELCVPASVFIELAYLMSRRRSVPRQRVADALSGLMRLQGLHIQDRDAITAALDLWRSTGGLSFVDCYHLALTKALGMSRIYTFDRKMDRYPGVERIEP